MRAAVRLRLGLRAALRRRYGYAALRHMRKVVARAVGEHFRRTYHDPRPYDGVTEGEALYRGYWTALRKLRQRWPSLDPSDPRAEP